MNDAVPRTLALRSGGLSGDSGVGCISEGEQDQEYDGIDWSAAAPSWASIFTGLVLPVLALVLSVTSLDLALSWLVDRWIDPGVVLWLLAMMMLPFALIGAFFGGKLFIYLNGFLRAH